MTYVMKKTVNLGRIPAGGYCGLAFIVSGEPFKEDSDGAIIIPPGGVEKVYAGEELPPLNGIDDQSLADVFPQHQYSDNEMSMSILRDIAESTPFKRILCTHYGHIDFYWPTTIRSTFRALYTVATPIIRGKDGEPKFHTTRGDNNRYYPDINRGMRWGMETLGCWISDVFDQNKSVPKMLEKYHMGGNYFVVEPKKLRKFDS